MKYRMAWVLGICLVGALSCTTYHAAGPSGGFSETRLSETSYQVRFRGNGYASPARVESFVLRRSAELALENGYRYFILQSPQNLDRNDMWRQYAERGATVRFVSTLTSEAADAVIVIRDTDELAGGRLSESARKALAAITSL